MSSFADRVIAFNESLSLNAPLPQGVRAMNPFGQDSLPARLSAAFYKKYYNDNQPRHLILGINPGRFGAALSGIPFTDFKRLETDCNISAEGHSAHEPSSEFVYAVIKSFGGPDVFYARFYINSVCPLGFVIGGKNGREVNYNYYDDPALFAIVKPFIIQSIRAQIALGCATDVCICMGVKNATYLQLLNEEHHFFGKIIVLPHPRYIIQYRRKALPPMVDEYLTALSIILHDSNR